MSSKSSLGLALDMIAQIQQHLNAIDNYVKSVSLDVKQRANINKRRQTFEDLAGSAMDLYKVLKSDFLFQQEQGKNAQIIETLRKTRALSFEKWKVLKENNLLHLLK